MSVWCGCRVAPHSLQAVMNLASGAWSDAPACFHSSNCLWLLSITRMPQISSNNVAAMPPWHTRGYPSKPVPRVIIAATSLYTSLPCTSLEGTSVWNARNVRSVASVLAKNSSSPVDFGNREGVMARFHLGSSMSALAQGIARMWSIEASSIADRTLP
jgi:hypothetical protein